MKRVLKAHRGFESYLLRSFRPQGFFHFPCSFSLAFLLSFWYIINWKERGKRSFFMKKSLCLDTIVIAAPLAMGFALVLPFVAYEIAKQLIKDKLGEHK
jgi:hypothetical protein